MEIIGVKGVSNPQIGFYHRGRQRVQRLKFGKCCARCSKPNSLRSRCQFYRNGVRFETAENLILGLQKLEHRLKTECVLLCKDCAPKPQNDDE